MAERCIICNSKLGKLIGPGVKVKDGIVCAQCLKGYEFETVGPDILDLEDLSVDELGEASDHGYEMKKKIIPAFIPTYSIEFFAKFDDENKQMLISKRRLLPTPRSFHLFSYDQIVDYELIENGNVSASDALDGAIIGGMLFGGAGAVVGSNIKGSVQKCMQLQVKLTIRESTNPAYYVTFINHNNITPEGSDSYHENYKAVHDFISKIKLILEDNKKQGYDSIASSSEVDNNNQTIGSTTRASINPNDIEPTIIRISQFLEDCEWSKALAYVEAALDYFPTDSRLYLLSLCSKNKVKTIDALNDHINNLREEVDFKRAKKYASEEELKKYEDLFIDRKKEKEAAAKEETELIYKEAYRLFDEAESVGDYIRIKNTLEPIEDNGKAKQLIEAVDAMIEAIGCI